MTTPTKQEALEALDFIEANYIAYEDNNNKIKGMYISLDKIRDYINNADDKSKQEGGWMPISNFPPDCAHITVWIEYKDKSGAGYYKDAFVYKGEIEVNGFIDWDYEHKEITHWMYQLRPTPPETKESEE